MAEPKTITKAGSVPRAQVPGSAPRAVAVPQRSPENPFSAIQRIPDVPIQSVVRSVSAPCIQINRNGKGESSWEIKLGAESGQTLEDVVAHALAIDRHLQSELRGADPDAKAGGSHAG